jgi:hypothetical protein
VQSLQLWRLEPFLEGRKDCICEKALDSEHLWRRGLPDQCKLVAARADWGILQQIGLLQIGLLQIGVDLQEITRYHSPTAHSASRHIALLPNPL